MTVSFWPFPKGSTGSQVLEPQWSLMARNWLATGVIKGFFNELAVTANGTAMQVNIDTGAANVMGDWIKNDASVAMPIAAADATNPRIDVIAIRVDWVANTVAFVVLEGTPAASPVAPALTQTDILTTPASARWEISLAQVYVGANVATILQSNITDERTFTAYTFATGATANTMLLRDSNGGGTVTELTRTNPSAFRAYQTTSQSVAAGAFTKVQFEAKVYDNLSEFDSTTNYRFTASRTGIYLFSSFISWTGGQPDGNRVIVDLYVNGNDTLRLYDENIGALASAGSGAGGTGTLKLNANDYVEVYIYTAAAQSTAAAQVSNYFEGVRIA